MTFINHQENVHVAHIMQQVLPTVQKLRCLKMATWLVSFGTNNFKRDYFFPERENGHIWQKNEVGNTKCNVFVYYYLVFHELYHLIFWFITGVPFPLLSLQHVFYGGSTKLSVENHRIMKVNWNAGS